MRIAVVEKSSAVREAIAELLRSRGRVVVASSLGELVHLGEPLDVVVVDFAACVEPVFRQNLQALRQRWPALRLVVATPGDEGEYERAAASFAADEWVPKPRLGLLLPQVLDRLAQSLATAR